MGETFANLNGGQLIGVIAIISAAVGGTVISVSAIVLPQWRKVRQLEEEVRFKQDLLASGMSPDDVVRVVQASSLSRRPLAEATSSRREAVLR